MARFSYPISELAAASSRITINVMTVMDVVAIMKKYSNLSMDPTNPTPIGHDFIYMVSDDSRGWSWPTPGGKPDMGNISLTAIPGDTLSFFCSSMPANSDSAAFIYKINGGAPVLNPSSVNIIKLSGAAQPTPPQGYPFANSTVSFSSCDAKVQQAGTAANFWAYAALFTLAADGETQALAGYVGWDPTVTVG